MGCGRLFKRGGKMKKMIIFIATITMFFMYLYVEAPISNSYAKEEEKTRKILYYRNPMNPSITSEVPAKDHMGMDYIPVYEEERPADSATKTKPAVVTLDKRQVELSGVVSEEIITRHLFKEIRTVGRIAYDPALYKAEEELIQALKTKEKSEESKISDIKIHGDALVDAARLKLKLSGLNQEQIEEVVRSAKPDRSLIISDEKDPYVWVYADVYEYELSWIKTGIYVKVTSVSLPQEEFTGTIMAIDPLVNPETRSVRIRAKIDNPQLKLKPNMYVDVFIESYLTDEEGKHKLMLTVPVNAVLDTGMRKVVYIDLGGGSYEGREITIGPEASAYVDGKKEKFYPVTQGLKERDKVVTKANFLIDSQSQITGVSQAAYSGALGSAEEVSVPAHRH